jgi:hypothetical protein
MRKESALLLAVFLATLTMSAACKRGADSPDLSKLGPSSAATSTVLPVGNPSCPGGGIGIYAGTDTNGNGILEASEVLKGTPICGPLSDAGRPDGLVSLVMIASEPTGTLHCPAGGLKVLSGPDANRNGVLDANEIAFTEYLCNGTPGASSTAGITVAVAPPVAPSPPADEKKKVKKTAPAKKPAAAGKATGKAAPRPAAEAKGAQAAPAAPAKKDSAEARSAPEEKDTPVQPAAAPKKASEKAKPASPAKEKGGAASPAVPQGWTSVKTGSSQLASVAYKIEGRYITVRFTNLSAASAVRFKYTVRWKENQNGNWVDDATMEGISFRLKPQESLDREVRTQSQDIRDVVIDLEVVETS